LSKEVRVTGKKINDLVMEAEDVAYRCKERARIPDEISKDTLKEAARILEQFAQMPVLDAQVLLTDPDDPFPITTPVEKNGGEYLFPGTVVASFLKRDGQRRYVVEDDRKSLHIFSAKNLRRRASDEEKAHERRERMAWVILVSAYDGLSEADIIDLLEYEQMLGESKEWQDKLDAARKQADAVIRFVK
jgi:hypothetical protein